MMGRSHYVAGALCGGAIAATVDQHHILTTLAGMAVGSVGGLLPDMDEPGSSVSRALGPFGTLISRATNRLAGGHRQATHSLPFVALVALVATTNTATTITLALSAWIGLKFYGPRFLRWMPVRLLAVITLLCLPSIHNSAALSLAMTAGVLSHLVGDSLTPEGVPWAWPFTRRHVALPILAHTNSDGEIFLRGLMILLGAWMLAGLVGV